MTPRRCGGLPAPLFFVVGAVSQYLGAALAVSLFDRLSPTGVAWLRVAFSGGLLAAWRRPRVRRWTARQWRVVGAFGVTLAAMNVCFYLAVDRLPLGTAVAIEFSGPVAVAAAGTRTPRHLVALSLAAAGVVLLVDVRWRASSAGVLLALAAAVLWAGYIVLGRRVAVGGPPGTEAAPAPPGDEARGGPPGTEAAPAASVDGLDGLAWSMVLGAVALAPTGLPAVISGDVSPAVVAACAAVGVLSNVIPYGLDQVVLRRLSASRFALLLCLLPATAALVGALLLRQVPARSEAAGIALVVAAVFCGADR